jgi:hypothetical protein
MSDQRAEAVKALLIVRDKTRDRLHEANHELKAILGDRVPCSWTEDGITTEVQYDASLGKITITTEGFLA